MSPHPRYLGREIELFEVSGFTFKSSETVKFAVFGTKPFLLEF
jgi:hypothetical protein